jgi:hypothetical protein
LDNAERHTQAETLRGRAEDLILRNDTPGGENIADMLGTDIFLQTLGVWSRILGILFLLFYQPLLHLGRKAHTWSSFSIVDYDTAMRSRRSSAWP